MHRLERFGNRLRIVLAISICWGALAPRAGRSDDSLAEESTRRHVPDILDTAQWSKLDASVDRGLEYLSHQQNEDGSFETLDVGQPAISSLCVMAFLSRGHVPEQGPYGKQLSQAIEFVLSTQRADGLLYGQPVPTSFSQFNGFHTSLYNHAIAGLMLSEVYGMTSSGQQIKLREAITRAVTFTRQNQMLPKRQAIDKGGWRYIFTGQYLSNDSDLSATAWQLMFLRSARNAEFDVPTVSITEATDYIRGCFDIRQSTFVYCGSEPRPSGGIVGGGIVALSMGGEHQSTIALAAGDWILAQGQRAYNGPGVHDLDRYHYSTYYSSQAMFQLGGKHWATFYPPLLETLTKAQHADGSWEPEAVKDGPYGSTYTTSLAILALTPPYQILPIYQA